MSKPPNSPVCSADARKPFPAAQRDLPFVAQVFNLCVFAVRNGHGQPLAASS
jgi:hypothetical protein